jgi:hypothetical protein
MVLLDQLVYMNGHFELPRVIAVQITLPFDEIPELALLPLEMVIDDGFYFVLFFVSNQVGR